MTTSQQTGSMFEQTREARPNEHGERVATVQHIVRSEPDDLTAESRGRNGTSAETILRSQPAPCPPVYPTWPTSQPGPLAITPPPGQHPHPLRTDQMVYESYDQEKGIPGIPRPIPVMQEHEGKTALPDVSHQGKVFDIDALQRWLDDGGSLEKEATSEMGDITASRFMRSPGGVR